MQERRWVWSGHTETRTSDDVGKRNLRSELQEAGRAKKRFKVFEIVQVGPKPLEGNHCSHWEI